MAVDYYIIYQPPPESDTSQMVPLAFTGSVRFQGGETTRDFSVTLPDSAFLEVGGNFMAMLANASIVGGGKQNL